MLILIQLICNMNTNSCVKKAYFEKLLNAYNMIPAYHARVPLKPSETYYPVRDTLGIIADRAIQLEQQAGTNPLPKKEILLLELKAIAGNKDKNKAIYDITKKIHELGIEAIYAHLDKEIHKLESEDKEDEAQKLKKEKKYVDSVDQWIKEHSTSIDGSKCGIIGAPEVCLPKWYREIYNHERCSYLEMWSTFEPTDF